MNADTKRICADCKYFMRDIRGPLAFIPARCSHPMARDVITGRATPAFLNRHSFGPCGREAKLFEPKPPRKWWEFWR